MNEAPKPTLPGNAIDKVISYFAPERGLRRMAFRAVSKSRRFTEMAKNLSSGFYRGNRRGRSLREWVTGRNEANDEIRYSLEDLRSDSNDLQQNNAIACGAIDTYCTNIVGTGLQLCSTIDFEFLGMTEEQAEEWQDHVEREFELFSRTCDLTRTKSLVEQQNLVLRSTLVNGDVFVNLPMIERTGVRYETALNLIEGHRISTKPGLGESDRLVMGVELDENGCPVAYQYVSTMDRAKKREWRRLRAFDDEGNPMVLHVFRKKRVNQNRGIPLLAPIIEIVKKLDTYTQAEVDAAVINAFFTVFIKKKSVDDDSALDVVTNMGNETGAADGDEDLKLGAGTIIEMRDDEEDIKIADVNRPNVNFGAFFKDMVSQLAVGINMPYEVLMKAFNSSYSASKGAVIEATKVFDEWERFLVDSFCQPVYEAFLYEAVAKGIIDAPGFFDDPLRRQAFCGSFWIGPTQNELDPTKGVKAATARIENGTSNEIIETARLGRNYRRVMQGKMRARRIREKLNIPEPQAKSTPTSSGSNGENNE